MRSSEARLRGRRDRQRRRQRYPEPVLLAHGDSRPALWQCPRPGGPMILAQRLTPAHHAPSPVPTLPFPTTAYRVVGLVPLVRDPPIGDDLDVPQTEEHGNFRVAAAAPGKFMFEVPGLDFRKTLRLTPGRNFDFGNIVLGPILK
jgi:hypothetical protein